MKTPAALLSRLSLMMFLQYAIWGAWLPLLNIFLSRHRGFSSSEVGYMFMVGGVGAVFAPFIAGQIADRYFNTEKYLALSHILGGILVLQLAWIEDYWLFFAFSLLFSLIYSPTLALTNSLSFHHLPDRDRQFGKVRMWGTLGWVAVSIGIAQWLLYRHTPAGASEAEELISQAAGIKDAFYVSAALGIAMGLYCLTLPATPPSRSATANSIKRAIGEAKRQPLLMLFLIAVPIACVHQFYFVHTASFLSGFQLNVGDYDLAELTNRVFGVGGGGIMAIGQIAELLVLGMIPLLAVRWSRKTLLAVGIAAYAARMALFAYVDVLPMPEMVTLIAGVALHGVCFGCFIFVAFMIVDEQTTADVRASAQSLFGLVVFGIGIIVGSISAGYVGDWAASGDDMDYTRLFSVPMWGAVACLLALLAFYPGGSVPVVEPAKSEENA